MVPGVLEEQPGGPCSWSRESEEERARREWRQMFRALWASGRPTYLVGPYLPLTIRREGIFFPLVLMEQVKL